MPSSFNCELGELMYSGAQAKLVGFQGWRLAVFRRFTEKMQIEAARDRMIGNDIAEVGVI